jgi:hypothetical protein
MIWTRTKLEVFMPELVCPRCRPGATKLTQVITCIAQGQKNIANPKTPGQTLDMSPADTDKMRFPYFGKGRSKNLVGAGFVVGFKEDMSSQSGSNGKGNRWRLDYDTDKGLHVNFESDTLPKMAHRFGIIDAQPFVANVCDFPTGLSKLTDEEKVKSMWFSWTKYFVEKGRAVPEVLNEMANAYKDLGITDANSFVDRIKNAANHGGVTDLLQPTG